MIAPPPLPGALVISLDFELHWGVRDKVPAHGSYRPNLLGAREAVARMLALFTEFEVAGTWATVGFLFARNRAELELYSPAVRPAYRDAALDPFAQEVGEGEEDDPVHYAASLVEAIRSTPRQEVATHTFSHYYCGEPGQDREAFRADLAAALTIARARGIGLSSIVFPRNQHHPAYDDLLLAGGIRAYRGNPPSWMWGFETAGESATPGKRLARLLDSYVAVTGRDTVPWSAVPQPSGLCDVRASRLLRPYQPRLRHLEWARSLRIRRGIRTAARRREIYHLWWHPHNFGAHLEENLSFLRGLLEEFARCRERYGMRSLTMAEVGRRVAEARHPHPPSPRETPCRIRLRSST